LEKKKKKSNFKNVEPLFLVHKRAQLIAYYKTENVVFVKLNMAVSNGNKTIHPLCPQQVYNAGSDIMHL
jgi:hypothetical protein